MKKTTKPEPQKITLFTIPNLLTLCNLVSGSLAVVFTLRYDGLQMAFFMIVAAAVFDFLDGFSARLFHSNSLLGVQLDSLSDVVSFGVAPSAILLSMFESSGGVGEIGYGVFILAAFSALRLAKFNIDERQHDTFIGLPTPAAALFVASAGYMFEAKLFTVHPAVILAVALVLAVLLVSEIPMFALKFKHYGFRGNEIRYLFLGVSLIALLIGGFGAISGIILLYILVSIVSSWVCRSSRQG